MNAGKAVYGILSANSGVTDIVSTRIFPEIAEQEAVTPFIVYQLQNVSPEDTHDGPSKLDEVQFEFLCYADSYNAAADLGTAVRAALDRVSGTYNGVNVESVQFNDVDVEIEYDPRRYSQVLKFTFRIKRDDVEIALGTPVTGAQLGDLSDVNVDGVTDNQILSYDAATDSWVPAADAGGAEQLDDLSDVKIVGTPTDGDALVYSSGFWSRGTAGASTLGDLSDVNLTTPSTGAYLQYDGAQWIDSVITLPSVPSTYYHNRYATEAETLRSGATATVELYYTAQADGDGYAESASSDTATAGYDIRRKLYYSEAAQADCDSGTWVQFADIADDTTFSSAKATLLAYLKERTGGTVPISLKMTWEEVAEAPAFTGLLNESYGSGAAAAYSVRRLNGNYTGAAIQVERSSDNTTQDIGFDSNGDLDESALSTFCSGTVCKVRTWYGQEASGGTGSGNDAVQTDHSKQPTIYTGGAIVKENGRVAVDFDGTDDALDISITQAASNYTGTFVNKNSSTTSLFFDSTSGRFIFEGRQSNAGAFYDGSWRGTPTTSTNQILRFIIASSPSSGAAFTNGTQIDSGLSYTQKALGGVTKLGSSITGSRFINGPTQEFIIWPSDKSTDRTSIEENIGDYFTQNTPLLDTYTGAAAAYSLRKLRTAYSGSAIRVRRASDNTEQDIGFNVFGELDTVSLASFCSGTDGFVKTWYDQSGNANDATQGTTANQPKIYDSSTGVVTENGKPVAQFDGSNDCMLSSTNVGANPTACTWVHVVNANTKAVTGYMTSQGSNTNGGFGIQKRTTGYLRYYMLQNGSGSIHSYREYQTDISDGNTRAMTTIWDGTNTSAAQASLYVNGSAATLTSASFTGTYGDDDASSLEIASRANGTALRSDINVFELIVYPADKSSDQSGIYDNINAFYSIS